MADNITIIAELRDLISRPAGAAVHALRRMEQQINDLDKAYREGRISQDEYVKALRKMSRTSRLAGRDSKGFRKAIDKQIDSLGRNGRRGLRGVLGGAAKATMDFAGGVVKGTMSLIGAMPRVLKMATGLSILIPVIFAVVGGLVAMAGSAAPMIGLLGAIPGLGLAAGAGLGVLAVGITSLAEGIGMLASGTATVEEMNEFWAKFTPEAKEFGVAMASIAPGLTLIRDAIHRSMLPALGTALVEIAQVYVPFFEQKMGDIGSAIGRVAEYASQTFTNPAFMADMTKVWDSTTRLVERLGMAGVHVLSGLRGLMVAAIPMTEKVGEAIHNAFSRFDTWANSPVGREKMTDFFNDAWSTAQTFFGALKDILIGLWNIMMIGKDLGDTLGGGMSEAADRFREWTASTEGQERIRQFFVDIKDTLAALGRLGSAVFDELFKTGAGDSQQNSAVKLIDGITAAVPGIFEVIRALIKLAGWVGQAIVWTAKFFTMLGNVPGVGGLLQWIAGLLLVGTRGRIVFTILGFLGRLLLWVFTGPIASLLGFIGRIGMLILRSQMLWRIVGLVGRILLFAFGGWVGVLIAAIAGGIYLLWTRSETFRNMVKSVGRAFSDGWGQIRTGFIDPIIEGVQRLIDWIGRIDFPDAPDWMKSLRNIEGKDQWGWGREHGGPVMAGDSYRMGEAGREFLVTPSGVSLVGENGPEVKRMGESGFVLPNPVTERVLASSGVAAAGSSGSSGSLSGEVAPAMPAVQVGPFYGAHPDEVRMAVSQGIREAQRRSETKQGGGGRP